MDVLPPCCTWRWVILEIIQAFSIYLDEQTNLMNVSCQNVSTVMFIHCGGLFHPNMCLRPCPAVLDTFDLAKIEEIFMLLKCITLAVPLTRAA